MDIPHVAVLFFTHSELKDTVPFTTKNVWKFKPESLVEWKVFLITLNKTGISRLHPWHPSVRLQNHPWLFRMTVPQEIKKTNNTPCHTPKYKTTRWYIGRTWRELKNTPNLVHAIQMSRNFLSVRTRCKTMDPFGPFSLFKWCKQINWVVFWN